ncbi:hypothetical protein HK405_008508 [Cladochytrium tenue]|nr:hypothetical protein HK405_008508 [Cladochytrium tenue]
MDPSQLPLPRQQQQQEQQQQYPRQPSDPSLPDSPDASDLSLASADPSAESNDVLNPTHLALPLYPSQPAASHHFQQEQHPAHDPHRFHAFPSAVAFGLGTPPASQQRLFHQELDPSLPTSGPAAGMSDLGLTSSDPSILTHDGLDTHRPAPPLYPQYHPHEQSYHPHHSQSQQQSAYDPRRFHAFPSPAAFGLGASSAAAPPGTSAAAAAVRSRGWQPVFASGGIASTAFTARGGGAAAAAFTARGWQVQPPGPPPEAATAAAVVAAATAPSPIPDQEAAQAAQAARSRVVRNWKMVTSATALASPMSAASLTSSSASSGEDGRFVTEADMELAVVNKLRQEQVGEVEHPTVTAVTADGGGGDGGNGAGLGDGQVEEFLAASRDDSRDAIGNSSLYDGDDGEEYVDEIYDIVDAVVPRTDDPTLPAVNPLILVLIAYPMGNAMAATLPRRPLLFDISLNPGPFSIKEHALIYVFASACTTPAYALYNIIGQRYFLYQDSLSLSSCVLFSIATQCFGYGLAGLCRKFLVRPAAMLWPANLSTIALLKSLHAYAPALADPLKYKEEIEVHRSRFRFFWVATLCVFAWQWVPGYFAPLFAAVSVLCYAAPQSSRPDVVRALGSGYGGMGLLSVTLDWSLVTLFAPITTPLWALLNQFFGLWFLAWFLTPLLWARDAFGMDSSLGADPRDGPNGSGVFPLGHALNTGHLLNKDGLYIRTTALVDLTTLGLNETFYDENAPIRISTWFTVIYISSFVTFAGCLTHVWIWYGKDILHRFRTTVHDLDTRDVHAQMMDVYAEVPDLWYAVLLAVTLGVGVGVCQWGGFQLPWWGVLLGFVFALVSMIPIGTIQAISGQKVGLNVMSEFLIGAILPGNISGVMAFKTFSYMAMYQGLLLVSDLKLGHYLKIPPRAMFAAQLAATLLAAVVNVYAAVFIYEAFGRTDEHSVPGDLTSPLVWRLQSGSPPVGWTANQYQVFISAGAIWGAVGPSRFFGLSSPYAGALGGFLAGVVLPFVPYLLHRASPHGGGYWHLVNVPVLADVIFNPGDTLSCLVTPVAVGVAVNYFARKHRRAWWGRHAFVLAAALDSGTAAALAAVFLAFTIRDQSGSGGPRALFPFYALNRFDPELCAPDFYQTCKENAVNGGAGYVLADDPYCASIGFGSAGS